MGALATKLLGAYRRSPWTGSASTPGAVGSLCPDRLWVMATPTMQMMAPAIVHAAPSTAEIAVKEKGVARETFAVR